jgi:hypothetical protein
MASRQGGRVGSGDTGRIGTGFQVGVMLHDSPQVGPPGVAGIAGVVAAKPNPFQPCAPINGSKKPIFTIFQC